MATPVRSAVAWPFPVDGAVAIAAPPQEAAIEPQNVIERQQRVRDSRRAAKVKKP